MGGPRSEDVHRLDTDRHLGIVLDDEMLPLAGPAGTLDGDYVEAHLPVWDVPESGWDRRVEEGAALDDLLGDDLIFSGLQALEPLVDREHPPRQPPLQNGPVRGRQDAGHIVGWVDLIVRDHPHVTLILKQPPMRPVGSPPPFPRTHTPHLFEHRAVMRERLASRAEDLVGGGETALEAYRAVSHQLSEYPCEDAGGAEEEGE